jgi:hypothetical protein
MKKALFPGSKMALFFYFLQGVLKCRVSLFFLFLSGNGRERDIAKERQTGGLNEKTGKQ